MCQSIWAKFQPDNQLYRQNFQWNSNGDLHPIIVPIAAITGQLSAASL
jgi:hypothetical protein